MPTLLFLISLVAAIGMLICFVLVLIKMFRRGRSGLGITCLVLLCCGWGELIAFVYGWINAKAWNILNVMLAWTVCLAVSIVAYMMWVGTGAAPGVTIEGIVVEVSGRKLAVAEVGRPRVAAHRGDVATVSAEVYGVSMGEPVVLYYSTADGQTVDQDVPMTLSENGDRYQCQLPPQQSGLQQGITYYLTAGDCREPQNGAFFRIDVQAAPTILVDRVDYRYPEYTGIPARTVVRQGDLLAIEGTEITIHATANYPIECATIEMGGDARFAVVMRPDGTSAVGQFTLALSRENPTRADHEWYQLRFNDPEGRANRRPIRSRIDVIRDLPPEVRLVEPPQDQAQLPVDGALDLRVDAVDPDFALRQVAVCIEHEEKNLPIRPLLNKVRPDQPHQGPFEAAYHFEPAKLGLKPGDKVVYLAEAADNKEPEANRSETERRMILIAPPESRKSEGQP
ncbi:hypothetical protein ACFL5Q_06665 [Planctomycetota bacterium]